MALTAANVRTEVRAILNEPVAAFWSDAEIDAWVTQAAQSISMTGVVETTATVTIVASTIEYAVPTTFANPTVTTGQLIKIAAAHYGGRGLIHVHVRTIGNINADTTSNDPTVWALHGQRFFLAPVGSGASGTVTLYCHVETDDIADIPDIWQPLAITYAAAKGKQKDGRFAEAAALLGEYTNALAFLRNDILERGVDSRQMMTIPTRIVTQ
jgi:hypothetical protein